MIEPKRQLRRDFQLELFKSKFGNQSFEVVCLDPWCLSTQEKAGHRLAKTGQKNRKYEGEGATSKAGRWKRLGPRRVQTCGANDKDVGYQRTIAEFGTLYCACVVRDVFFLYFSWWHTNLAGTEMNHAFRRTRKRRTKKMSRNAARHKWTQPTVFFLLRTEVLVWPRNSRQELSPRNGCELLGRCTHGAPSGKQKWNCWICWWNILFLWFPFGSIWHIRDRIMFRTCQSGTPKCRSSNWAAIAQLPRCSKSLFCPGWDVQMIKPVDRKGLPNFWCFESFKDHLIWCS